jgi:hypothetical protein
MTCTGAHWWGEQRCRVLIRENSSAAKWHRPGKPLSSALYFFTGVGVVSKWALASNKVWPRDMTSSATYCPFHGRGSRGDFQSISRPFEIFKIVFFAILVCCNAKGCIDGIGEIYLFQKYDRAPVNLNLSINFVEIYMSRCALTKWIERNHQRRNGSDQASHLPLLCVVPLVLLGWFQSGR